MSVADSALMKTAQEQSSASKPELPASVSRMEMWTKKLGTALIWILSAVSIAWFGSLVLAASVVIFREFLATGPGLKDTPVAIFVPNGYSVMTNSSASGLGLRIQ